MNIDLVLFSKAFLLGWMVAIPVGPVALLIIQRSLTVGYLRGLASGLGAALADGLFGLVAALGLAALLSGLTEFRHLVRPFGSLALMVVGVFFYFRKPPSLEAEEVLAASYLHHYLWDILSTFLLTIMNPMTIIAFAALFVGSDLIPEERSDIQYMMISTGVFCGSLFWWCLLGLLAQPLKKRLSPLVLHRTLQVIGMVLVGLALLSFIPRIGTVVDKAGSLIHKINL
jgi:threonine/homoserine/homoserine lactone efflux protein